MIQHGRVDVAHGVATDQDNPHFHDVDNLSRKDIPPLFESSDLNLVLDVHKSC